MRELPAASGPIVGRIRWLWQRDTFPCLGEMKTCFKVCSININDLCALEKRKVSEVIKKKKSKCQTSKVIWHFVN